MPPVHLSKRPPPKITPKPVKEEEKKEEEKEPKEEIEEDEFEGIKIVNLDKKKKNNKLFANSWRLQCTGCSGSGKTNCILSLLLDKKLNFSKAFDRIYLFCPSVDFQDKYKLVIDKGLIAPDDIFPNPSSEKLQEILDGQLWYAKNDQPVPRILILFDDVVNDKFIRTRAFSDVITRSRTANISIIFITQGFAMLPKQLRTNFNYQILFPVKPGEVELVYEHMGSLLSLDDFKAMVKHAHTPVPDVDERPFLFYREDDRLYSKSLRKKLSVVAKA